MEKDIVIFEKIIYDENSEDEVKERDLYKACYSYIDENWTKGPTDDLARFVDIELNKERLREILDRIRIFVNFLEKELKNKKKLNQKERQKIFDAFNNILKYYIGTLIDDADIRTEPKIKMKISDQLDVLKMYEFELDKLSIYCFFPSVNKAVIQIRNDTLHFEIERVVQQVFKKYVSKITFSTVDVNKQPQDVKDYLIKKLADWNLTMINKDFWEKIKP